MLPKSQLISLSAVLGMGPRRIRAIFRKYPNLDGVTQLSKSDLMQVEGISSDLAGKTQNIDLDIGKQAAEKTAAMGARYLTYWDPEYPEMLKMIYDARQCTIKCISVSKNQRKILKGNWKNRR